MDAVGNTLDQLPCSLPQSSATAGADVILASPVPLQHRYEPIQEAGQKLDAVCLLREQYADAILADIHSGNSKAFVQGLGL